MGWAAEGFEVHASGKPRRGSKVGTVVFILLVLGLAGGVGYFLSDVPGLIQHVSERDALALPAAHALAWLGAPPDAEEPLKRALDEGEPGLRAAAATALGTRRSDRLVSTLGASAVSDDDEQVRAAATEAIGANGETLDAVRFLREAITDESPLVQAAACRAIGALELSNGDLLEHLVMRVDHHDRSIRAAALEGLEAFTEDGVSYGHDRGQWMDWLNGR